MAACACRWERTVAYSADRLVPERINSTRWHACSSQQNSCFDHVANVNGAAARAGHVAIFHRSGYATVKYYLMGFQEDEATPRRLLQHKHQSYPEYITVKQVRSIQAICKFAAAQLPTFKISCDLLVGGRVVHQFAHLDLKASLTAHVLLDSILLRLRQSGCFSEEEVQQLFAADLRLQ
ncbi:unnamed protein product [Effrenium voratum]|nr:unnamed protein product [Effrenium voratum]